MKTIEEILEKYSIDDYQKVHDTIDELCSKGIGAGCYQDYTVLVDIVNVLSYFEELVKKRIK